MASPPNQDEDEHDNHDTNQNHNASTSQLRSALWHGLGLFGESYLLFSVGTLRPLWETLYPACFDTNDYSQCHPPYWSYQSITYSVVLGVMTGMIVVGILANSIGRRRGSILTASLMTIGAIILTLCSIFLAHNPSILFPTMSLCLFVFGVGVGGEYPLSASSASERAMAAMKERRRREAGDYYGGKMKELLNVGDNENPLTPRHDNTKLSKREALLRGSANAASGASADPKSWQTLGKQTSTSPHNNNTLNINTSPNQYYYEGGVPLSPTNLTKETHNSLSTYNASLRTRGKEVLWVFSMQGMGIFANSVMLSILLGMARQKSKNENDDAQDVDDAANDDGQEDGNADNSVDYYNPTTLLNIWRITYAMGAAILIYVLVSRIAHLTESEVWAKDHERCLEERKRKQDKLTKEGAAEGGGFEPPSLNKMGPYEKQMRKEEAEREKLKQQQRQQQEPVISPTMSSITMKSEFDLLGSTNLDGCKIVDGCKMVPAMMMDGAGDDDDNHDDNDSSNTKKRKHPISSEIMLLFRHYGVRLFGTSMTWLLWDIAYYGNKLFQSSFLIALTGEDATLLDITCASAINAFVALLGYYAAAAIVDDPDCGRLTLQQTGFIITGTLFLLCGCLNDRISSTWLIVMYFGSSFFGQCGPNCTTYLIPAEVFPTSMRAMCHGISACAGKFGALIASILFNFLVTGNGGGGERDLFLFSGYASFAASLITFLTIPETTSLDLYEIDKQWHAVLRDERYEGPATDPKYLSFYERNQNRLCCRR